MATRYLINLLKVFLYYLLLFAVCWLVFLLYFKSEITEGTGILFQSLWRALPLDISMASYLLFVPVILLAGSEFIASNKFLLVLKAYLIATSLVIVVLSICEIGVYREMHVKLYFNLLSHLAHPGELFLSVSFSLLFIMVFLLFAIIHLCVFVLKKAFPEYTLTKVKFGETAKIFFVFAITIGLLVIGSRGGLQPIPINEGEVYFSHNQCVNDATVNPLWNIIHSYIENKVVLKGDAYKVMPDDEAQEIVRGLFAVNNDSTARLFKTARPNICILILESWSADVVASAGGYEGLTPNFESIAKEGYLFTNIKPAGHVSDQGVPAILSGYPALPIGSVINQPERQVRLPCLNNELMPAGYNSSFFFGGQLIYGNIKSYIYRNGFNMVIEQKDLPASLPAGRLGINDSVMLSLWCDSIAQMKPPFFSCLFTLSTHSPFDMPSTASVGWGGTEMPYLNSIVYADRQLGKFFEEAKKQPWYDSTVFILVADHSHGTPKNYSYCSPEFYHIPLLICGGALKEEYRGRHNEEIGSQTDIAATLLNQLQLSDTAYRWSKNLLNSGAKHFAFYTFDGGFGYTEPGKQLTWNKKFPTLNANSGPTPPQRDSLYKKGAAMLQVLMKDFLSK